MTTEQAAATAADTTQTTNDGGDVADTATTEQVSTESQKADGAENQQAEGQKADGEGQQQEGKDPEGKADGQEGTDGDYTDFTLPEGFTMDTEMLGKFVPAAQAVGLSQEQAQQFIDMHAEAIKEATTKTADEMVKNEEVRQNIYTEMVNARLDKLTEATMDDAAVGGEKSKEALSNALAAVEALDKDVPGLLQIVQDPELGLGSHVGFVKLMEKLGTAVKSHGFQSGGASGGNGGRAADRLYSNNENVN